ncbi:MAG TPA: hypothetical protein VHZ78_06285 [Rhizomicrobium sp.]|jgi:hypothetical protein|nr:hypothetical protein [Rhizomicrobium sp.]
MTNDPPRRGVDLLEINLDICQEQIRKALARADAIDPARDEFGHAASAAYRDAMAFLKTSAKVGLALAKLKSEHTTNIHVHRTETRAEAGPTKLSEARSKLALEAARRAGDEEFWERWSRTFHAEENRAAEAAEEGVPTSNLGGSNTSGA